MFSPENRTRPVFPSEFSDWPGRYVVSPGPLTRARSACPNSFSRACQLIDDVDGASGLLPRTLRTRDDTMNRWLRPPGGATGTIGQPVSCRDYPMSTYGN